MHRRILDTCLTRTFTCTTASVLVLSIGVIANADQVSDIKEVRVPLTVSETAAGTYKANMNIGIGTLRPLSFVLDTGSTGSTSSRPPGWTLPEAASIVLGSRSPSRSGIPEELPTAALSATRPCISETTRVPILSRSLI